MVSSRAAYGALFVGSSVVAQTEMPVKGDRAVIIAFAQKAAMRAVNFNQGDIASLNHAGADFTPEAYIGVGVYWGLSP